MMLTAQDREPGGTPVPQLRLVALVYRRVQVLTQVVGYGRDQGQERVGDPRVNRDEPAPVRPDHRVRFADDPGTRKGMPRGPAHQAGDTDVGGCHQMRTLPPPRGSRTEIAAPEAASPAGRRKPIGRPGPAR